MNKTKYPPEIQAFIDKHTPDHRLGIIEYSRYENIYEVYYKIRINDKMEYKTVYIRVEKDRMSDSRIH